MFDSKEKNFLDPPHNFCLPFIIMRERERENKYTHNKAQTVKTVNDVQKGSFPYFPQISTLEFKFFG